MAELKELYLRMERERLEVMEKRRGAREERARREAEFLASSKMHVADVRDLTDRDFRYMEHLETAFAGALELINDERWMRGLTSVDMEDVVPCEDRYGDACLTVKDTGWYKCEGRDEPTGVQVDILVYCAMPEMKFSGYFTSPDELTQREKRNVANLVLEPGNEQLERIVGGLSGVQEYVCMPYSCDGGGELVIFRDGNVFDSEGDRWFANFKKEHFAPDSIDEARLSVMIALDINHPEV